MKQRGRRSADAKAIDTVVNVDGTPSRLEPPPSLSAAERVVFANIVAFCDADHFRMTDAPLLCRYAEAVVLAEKAAQELRRHGAVMKNGRVSGWITVQEKSVRALVSLSMRLRLSPQARLDAKKLARQGGPRPSVYDLMRNGAWDFLDDDRSAS
jgi:phage terminase small subunit